jgi:hypothetical protein
MLLVTKGKQSTLQTSETVFLNSSTSQACLAPRSINLILPYFLSHPPSNLSTCSCILLVRRIGDRVSDILGALCVRSTLGSGCAS